MKLIAVAFMFVLFSATAADTSLRDAVTATTATVEWRRLPSDFVCFQPGIVQLAVRTIAWQTARIAGLERQLAERK